MVDREEAGEGDEVESTAETEAVILELCGLGVQLLVMEEEIEFED